MTTSPLLRTKNSHRHYGTPKPLASGQASRQPSRQAPSRRRPSRRRSRTERGTASLELLICLFPVLFTFLAILQYGLLFIGRLVVEHAAHRAVRSAIVLLDDAPEHHGGAIRGDLTDGETSKQTLPTSLQGAPAEAPAGEPAASSSPAEPAPAAGASSVNPDPGSFLSQEDNAEEADQQGGARLTAIRRAAYAPLAILAPPISALQESTAGQAVSLSTFEQLGIGLLLYGRAAASITLHQDPNVKGPSYHFGPDSEVTVRIAFLMPCRVPFAAQLMCKSGLDLLLDDDLKRLDHVASKELRDLLLLSNLRFMILDAQASGLNQGASYYRPEDAS